MKQVVIIGGGITGLAAAYSLQERAGEAAGGVDYLLVERDHRLGGKILTEKVDGFTIEGGPDCFLSEKPWVGRLSAQMGIEHRLLGTNEENKGTYILSGGRLHALPEGLMLMVPTRILPFVTSPLISWPGKLRMAMDLVIPARRNDADESLAGFVTRRLGREALDKIAEPLIGGIHCGDAGEMSLKASFPRFIQMERTHGSLIRAMLSARRRANPHQAGAGREQTYFMSFVDGMGELPRSVASRLDPGRILTGRAVTRLEKKAREDGAIFYVVHVEGMQPVEAAAVIVATLADDAAALMEDLDPVMARQLGEISLASSATVSLAFRRADLPGPLRGFGFVVPRTEKRRIMAVTYSSVKWKYRTADPGHFLLRAFVGGAQNQHLVLLDDGEMIKMVRRELKDILGIAAEPLLTRVYRWIRGMSQYTLGHLDRMAAIEERSAGHPGLFLAGGSYRGIGIGDCINSGTLAAEKALAYLKGLR